MEENTNYVSTDVNLNENLEMTPTDFTIGNQPVSKHKYNRATRRKAKFYKGHEYLEVLHKVKDVIDKDGNHEAKEVPVAYLSPTKGWRGNRAMIASRGYNVKRRSTIGR